MLISVQNQIQQTQIPINKIGGNHSSKISFQGAYGERIVQKNFNEIIRNDTTSLMDSVKSFFGINKGKLQDVFDALAKKIALLNNELTNSLQEASTKKIELASERQKKYRVD